MQAVFRIPSSCLASEQSLGDLGWPAKTQGTLGMRMSGFAASLVGVVRIDPEWNAKVVL